MKFIKIILMIVFSFCLLMPVTFAAQKSNLSIMTFNIENGGTQVDFNKVIEAIKKSNADVVGIQEAWGNTKRIANALGWKYYDSRQHVISKYPLLDAPSSEGDYVFVEVQPGKVIAIANTHLPDEPYGPDLVRKGASVKEIEANERKVRVPTILPVMKKMLALAKQQVPVFITGDFNSPSALDWTKNTNHPFSVSWPVTKTLTANGLEDSFRNVHPSAVAYPAVTWPAGRPNVRNTTDNFNPSVNDPSDRIDFIFAANARVVDSQIVGERGAKNVDITVTPWPSDHRAVVSRFEVVPVISPINNLEPISNRFAKTDKKPEINVAKTIVKEGETIRIQWQYAPGNGYDYITIVPLTAKSHDEGARLYTHAAINGTLQYDASNVAGNWTAWNKAAITWPLKAGAYAVKLMSDDGEEVLASTKLTIVR